jgi:hypothetical protein
MSASPPLSITSSNLLAPLFSYPPLWFVEIYAKGHIPNLLLVRAIMGLARNIVGGVKFTFTMTGISVHVAEWH